jgi:hypothetical protein
LRQARRFVAVLVGIVALASGLVYAQYDRGYYSVGNGGSIRRFAIPPEMHGAVYSVGVYPIYPPELAPGEGREDVQSYCSTCHSTRYITMQPVLPPDVWTAEVNKMVNVMGAGIPEDVQPVIIKYLQAHYTPETRKR